MQLPRALFPGTNHTPIERFVVVIWWSLVVLLVTTAVMCAVSRRHWKSFLASWVSVYITLAVVYIVVFTDVRRRGYFPTNFETHPAFNSTTAPIADYPASEIGGVQPTPKEEGNAKVYYALRLDEIRGARPDFDAVVRSELDHRIEYGHYSDCPDPSLVRPRWGGRGGDIPGVLGGVW